MSNEHNDQPPIELRAVEHALAAVAPAPPRVDRDRLMFLAGVASATPDTRLPTPSSWLWPASTAALAATALGLTIALLLRPAPPTQIVYRDPIAPTATPVTTSPVHPGQPFVAALQFPSTPPLIPADNYVRSRDVALRFGLDALGSGPSGSGQATPAPTYRSLLESLSQPRPRPARGAIESSQM